MIDDEELEMMTEFELEEYSQFEEDRYEEIQEQKDFETFSACICGACGFKDGKLFLVADCCCGAL